MANVLAPGESLAVTVDVAKFGNTPGFYYLQAVINTVPTADVGEPTAWMTFFCPRPR
jgi:hypothetical protein